MAKGIIQIWKDIAKKSRIYRTKKALDDFYASHMVSVGQRKNVSVIRNDYEKKIDLLKFEYEKAHHNITLQFIEHELAYLNASHAEKEAKQKDAEKEKGN